MNRWDQSRRSRNFRAIWRDTILLFGEFFWPLTGFISVIIGGGYLYYSISLNTAAPLDSLTESIYLILALTFLQPTVDFPKETTLQIFFFLMPVIGVGLLAQGVAEFGALFFNRRFRGKEWEMAVASTFKNHIIIVGLGHLGYQAVKNLQAIEQDIVGIDIDADNYLLETLHNMDVPVLIDDANKENVLLSAGIKHAKTIMLCPQNDSLNLKIAIKARALNPNIRVVVRIFDHDFASALHDQFQFVAMSSSEMSAPSFAAAAAGIDITRPITVHGQSLSMARLEVSASSKLVKLCIGDIEQRYNVSVVLWQNGPELDYHPPGDAQVCAHETLVVLAGLTEISKLMKDNT